MKLQPLATALTALGLLTSVACSATEDDASKLGGDLTSVGAEKVGSKDGTIPAFAGMSKPSAGWAYGKVREDYWKYKGEKPSVVIDASNVDKYADKLTPGQVQMIKQIKGYTMPVYPTHRECGFPDTVAENTKSGALKSTIGKDGWSLDNATLPGVPFPMPQTGIQVMWNWLMRYQGAGVEWRDATTLVSPRPGTTQPIVVHFNQLMFYPWAKNGRHTPQDESGLQNGTYYLYTDPAALAGQGTMQRYYFNKDTDTYYYFTGQRRVRRLPAYSYDAPLIGFENQYPADISFGFYGNPDRFDWKLVGKKEVYVPYNQFAMQRFDDKLDSLAGPSFVNANYRRYELHRVWEIEGTVKSGVRHSTPKKTLYVDEDSWLVAVGDDYDAQGKIWKSKENSITPEWEIGACAVPTSIYSDLISGRYVLDNTVVGSGKDVKYYPPGSSDSRLTSQYFTGENLGKISDR
ncbi:uncharacterized protein DUF1329 [Paraburkholderia sp. BL27I4N3]|uniref:DUF1329 domain-containing protein n=1 Tax=Paraburkholderia sp. BL27I4N3 TaxID=1938805 RepID=UPI000E259A03|nr:DUF1329 domain-containing protein [Paraburkholderia sp. BL27I4N3]REE18121.1 uncharacterized protein DUF1329 [Paraburkholderia sp. BL27I4N3]